MEFAGDRAPQGGLSLVRDTVQPSGTVSRAPVLVALRSATRDAHDRLESKLDILARLHDRPLYTRFLVGLHSVYAPLEESVSACALTRFAIPDWSLRAKSLWLAEDMQALGASAAPIVDIRVASVEDIVGSVYVMEGATLGGAVILRELGNAGALPPHRFFFGYGDKRGSMWAAFRSQVAALDGPKLDRGRVIQAAQRTFRAVEDACAVTSND